MERIKRIFIGILVFSAFVLGFNSGSIQTARAEEIKELKLGILPVYSYFEVFNRAKPLKEYLGEKLGINVILVFSKDMDEYLKNAEEGKLDILFLNPPIYIKIAPKAGVREKGYLAVGRVVNNTGTDKFRGIIAARKDNQNIKKLEDIAKPGLKGMCTAKNSAAGYTSQEFLLADKGIDVNQLNLSEAPTQKHEESLMALYNREVDFAFFREETIDVVKGMVDMDQIQILSYGAWLPEWCFCLNPKLSSELAAKIKDALVGLSMDDPKQAEVLKANKIKAIVAAKDEDYNEYRAMCDKVKYKY